MSPYSLAQAYKEGGEGSARQTRIGKDLQRRLVGPRLGVALIARIEQAASPAAATMPAPNDVADDQAERSPAVPAVRAAPRWWVAIDDMPHLMRQHTGHFLRA